MHSLIFSLGKEQLQKLFDENTTYLDILRLAGYQTLSANYNTLYRVIEHFSIDLTKFKENYKMFKKRMAHNIIYEDLTYEEVIARTTTRRVIKRYIITKNLIPYICSECGNDGNYNGKELILQLDHVDGNPVNNNLENLRFLCPNCHSQTDTFAGRNPTKLNRQPNCRCLICSKPLVNKTKYGMCKKCFLESEIKTNTEKLRSRLAKRKFEVSKEELEKLLEEHSFTKIGKMFGVSDNAIRRRCVTLGIDVKIGKFSKKS